MSQELLELAQLRQQVIRHRALLAADLARLDNQLNAIEQHEKSLRNTNTNGNGLVQ
jgi:hypothetical protein